jgi:hypothetical protein
MSLDRSAALTLHQKKVVALETGKLDKLGTPAGNSLMGKAQLQKKPTHLDRPFYG